MRTVAFVGAKGGVGTSVTAARVAGEESVHQPVHLTAPSLEGLNDLATVIGLPNGSAVYAVSPSITLSEGLSDERLNVVDCGTDYDAVPDGAIVYIVLRNDYLSLRRAMALSLLKPDGYIAVLEAERALSIRDIYDVLGISAMLVLVNVDPAIARAVDAGILLARPGRHKIDLPMVPRACEVA